jgi:hypothetical protein
VVAAQGREAHGPKSLSGPSNSQPRYPSGEPPPRSRARRCAMKPPPHSRDPDPRASFRLARGPPRTSLRLARGTRTAERVSASLEAALDPRHRTCSSDRSIKCSGMSRAPGSKANPRHVGPLTPSGNHIPVLFDQPVLCGHPRRCAGVVREGRCHSMTLCRPLPYLLHVAPSKGDGGTLERGTVTYSALARDDAVT